MKRNEIGNRYFVRREDEKRLVPFPIRLLAAEVIEIYHAPKRQAIRLRRKPHRWEVLRLLRVVIS
jgi:hypothetical protein